MSLPTTPQAYSQHTLLQAVPDLEFRLVRVTPLQGDTVSALGRMCPVQDVPCAGCVPLPGL